MKEKKLVPKRRFRFFTYMWDKRKLEEVAPLQRGFDLIRSNMNNGPYPVVFSNGIGAWNSIYKVKGPGVVTGRSGSIGNVSYIEHHYWPHNTTLWVTKFFENYPLFIYYLYEKMELSKFASGSGVPTLNRNDVHSYSVFIPNPKEQQKIGKFFKVLDERIANQERKIAKVKALKEAYLTEMFPQEGETVPKRRFGGFEGEWEERDLKEIAPLRGGYAFKSSEFKEHGVPIIRISNILPNGTVGGSFAYYHELEDDANLSLSNGSIVIAMSGATTGKVAILNEFNNNKIYQNQRVGYFRRIEIIDYDFVSILVRTSAFMNQLSTVLVAGAQPNISSAQIGLFQFKIPKTKKEQQKIGQFFKNIDNQIATEESKLEKLKKMKEAYLEEMFV